MTPPQSYLTLTLRGLGFSTFKTNLLAIPYSVLNIINMIVLAFFSRKVKERAFVSMLANVWVLPLLIALETLPANTNPWSTYAILTLLLAYPYCE
jgi:hypothetical protein